MGGSIRPIAHMKAFSDPIEENWIPDLLYKGDPYAWYNKRQGSNSIYAHLDQYLCNFYFVSIIEGRVLNSWD